MTSGEPMVILLAEDDDGHATLIRRNLTRSGVANEVAHVKDGQEALDYIHGRGDYAGRRPHGPLLLLADINMPRVDGVELLRQLKSEGATAGIPVIMLTTTDDPREVERCYQLGCSVYITKPVRYEDFAEAVKRLGLFLDIVQVPPQKE
jgi:CheY-like chemotaxis protein